MALKFNPLTGKLDEYGPVLTGTGTVSAAADGTAALPGIAFTNDLNTGIYRPGADQLAISTGGTGRVFITSDGKLGLGTSSPSSPLTVQTSGATLAIRPLLRLESTVSGGVGGNGIGGSIDFYDEHADGLLVESARICSEVTDAAGSSRIADLAFYTTGSTAGSAATATEKVRITGAGSVGIGTTSASEKLDLNGALRISGQTGSVTNDAATIDWESASSALRFLPKTSGDGIIKFYTSSSGSIGEKARLDSSGRLLVGTASTTADSTAIFQGYSAATTGPSWLYLQRGQAAGSISSGNSLGILSFADNAANVFGEIKCQTDGSAGVDDYPGRLVFSTTADGAPSPTERMSITNEGYIFPDGSSRTAKADIQGTAEGFKIISASTDVTTRIECFATSTATRYGIAFSNPNGIVGSISTLNSATAFNTSSDYRLKENVVPLTGAADRVNQLQVHRFNFIADPDTTVDGFIAHEAQSVVPECVTGTKDEVDDEGNPVYQGIDQSKLVPLLTAALQEALQKIETLEQRLNDAGIA